MSFLMQARSTATGLLVAWVSSTPDFSGTGFPGPGMPEYVAVSAVVSEATGDGGVTAPLSPTDNGKFPQAQSGDLTYITATQLTADLNVFTSSLKGLTPASGGGTTNYLRADGSWDVPVNLPVSGGDDHKVALGLSGDLAFAANLRVGTAGDSLLFNGTATTGASLNFTSSGTLARGRNTAGTGNVDLLTWGSVVDRLWIGDSSGLAGASLLLKTGGDFSLNVNGTPEYGFDATNVTLNANNLVGAGFLSFSGIVAGSGSIRAAHSSTALAAGRNNANSADVPLIMWGASTDTLQIGSAPGGVSSVVQIITKANNLTLQAATLSSGSTQSFVIAGAAHTGLTASTEVIGLSINLAQTVQWATGAITNQRAARIAAPTYSFVGASTITTAATLSIGGAPTAGTNATITNSLALWLEGGALGLGATPALSGSIRLSNATNVTARNVGNSADLGLIRSDSSDNVLVGGTATGGDLYLDAASGKTVWIRFAGATQDYRFTSTFADFTDNWLQFGTNPASAGTLRFANNLPLIWRNTLNTLNVQGLNVGTDNAVYLGDSANASAAYITTAGSIGLRPTGAGSDSYTFSSTQANFRNSVLLLSSSPAASGIVRFGTNAGTLLASVNYDSTGDQTIINISGNTTFTDLRIGDESAKGTNTFYAQSKTQFIMSFSTAQAFKFDTAKMFVANTSAAPGDPTGGGHLYAEAGAGKWRGSSGTVTTFGPAEPHCPRCDRDFALEWESKRYGKLSVCMSCVVDALIGAGIPANEFVIERKVA